MKFRIKKFVLEALLNKASAVLLSKGDFMPILKNFHIKVDKDIEIIATDLELSIRASSDLIEIESSGKAIFPGKTLKEIINGCEDDVVLISVADDKALIKCAGAEWSIHLMNPDDYPEIPKIESCTKIDVPRLALITALLKVKGAAAKESVRPALQMINVVKGSVMASDGAIFRQVKLEALKDISLQFPVGAVEDLIKMLKNTETENIGIGETEDHILVFSGIDCFLITKNNVDYPDVEALLVEPARKNKYKLSVDKAALRAGIRRVRITADENTKGILVALKKNSLILRAKDRYGNMATEVIDVSWSHPDRTIGVNHEHILGAISCIDNPSLEILLGDDKKTRKAALLFEHDNNLAIINQLQIDFD
jgi:DNA polymerase-3 subunit beta